MVYWLIVDWLMICRPVFGLLVDHLNTSEYIYYDGVIVWLHDVIALRMPADWLFRPLFVQLDPWLVGWSVDAWSVDWVIISTPRKVRARLVVCIDIFALDHTSSAIPRQTALPAIHTKWNCLLLIKPCVGDEVEVVLPCAWKGKN